jgi:hypothetical protein
MDMFTNDFLLDIAKIIIGGAIGWMLRSRRTRPVERNLRLLLVDEMEINLRTLGNIPRLHSPDYVENEPPRTGIRALFPTYSPAQIEEARKSLDLNWQSRVYNQHQLSWESILKKQCLNRTSDFYGNLNQFSQSVKKAQQDLADDNQWMSIESKGLKLQVEAEKLIRRIKPTNNGKQLL